MLQFNPECFVWIDETGSDAHNHVRNVGYSLRGLPPIYHRIVTRGRRISAMAAICTEGLVGVELTYGTVNGEMFQDFIIGTVIPEMEPFDGTIKKSIIVMDNCSIHHVQQVQQLIKDTGILLFYLSPYSPDLNPIEKAFSSVKYYLKDHDEILQIIDDPFSIILSAFTENITSNKCKHWISDCGY